MGFLNRKKDKAADNHEPAPEKPKKAKKGKKGTPEPEPVLDLATALPSTDDFRTSLIMPSLSTRFSMLREQDDPNSIIGKASDDSVLQPKRQSRLHEFGFIPGGLSDIAEVSSIHNSVRPPFSSGRKDSNSSNATEEYAGSVMNRARPGEGNVLFGGRQKIYKIGNGGGSGRLLYEDDVNLSAFQKLRLEEKERREREAQEAQNSEPSSPVADTDSPMLEYSKKRETTSSTNSGNANARSSTAATSVSSQGANSIAVSSPTLSTTPTIPSHPSEANRTGTKTRRLYEQALDQQMQEQQSSAMNRLNSLQRTKAPTGRSTPPLMPSQPRSATNLHDHFSRMGSLNGRDSQSKGSSPDASRAQSPGPFASPLGSDSDEALMLSSALQPNDRGKATAMGAFNKPKQAFSEQQYAERLKQLQQDREGSAPKPGFPQKPSLRERAELARKRTNSGGKKESVPTSPAQSRSPTAKKGDTTAGASPQEEPAKAPTAFSVFERAATMMKAANATPPPPPNKPAPSPPTQRATDSQRGATFLDGDSDSEEGNSKPELPAGRPSESDRRPHNIPTASGPAPPILDHPALRSRSNTRTGEAVPPPVGPPPPIPTAQPEMRTPQLSIPDPEAKPTGGDVDSPTLGPTNGGLSGLVRQHLRNISTVSSEFDSDTLSNAPSAAATNPLSTQNLTPGQPSKAWNMDDLDKIDGESINSNSPIEVNKPTIRAGLESGILNTTQGVNQTITEWEKEMKRTHKREPSLEERQAFHKELARRQRAIQASLRENAAQNRSRNPSPAPGGGLKNALNMLRAKSSKESFATTMEHKQSDTNQALRVRGLGANSINASSTSLAGPYAGGDHWRSEERFGPREPPMRQKPMRILQQSEQDAQREAENRQRSGTNDSRAPRASTSSSSRGRSSSEVSNGRSRSRPRQYRDESEHGDGGRGAFASNTTPPLPTDRPSMESQDRGVRSRSNSKAAASAYFESKHLGPLQTNHGNGSSPHLTPASNGHPSLSPRPSPGMPSPNPGSRSPNPAFSAHNTPPLSASSTPIAPAFSSGAAAIMPSAHSLRKKSINKADISDPIFLSTTSVVDTINLPHGASLKNGSQDVPPPVPAINPMRRRFGLGRTNTDDSNGHSPYTDSMYTNSVDTLASKSSQPRGKLRKSSSEGRSLHSKSMVHNGPSPAMPSMPFGARNGSPPHPINDKPMTQQNMDGAMF